MDLDRMRKMDEMPTKKLKAEMATADQTASRYGQ